MHGFKPWHAGSFVSFWYYWLQVRRTATEGIRNLPFLVYTQKSISYYFRVCQHLVFVLHDDWSTRIKSSHGSHEVRLVLHRVPQRNQIQWENWENWEVVRVAFLLFVPPAPCRGLRKVVSYPVLPWDSRVPAGTQCLQPCGCPVGSSVEGAAGAAGTGLGSRSQPLFGAGASWRHCTGSPQPVPGYQYQLYLSWGAWMEAVSCSGLTVRGWWGWFGVWSQERKCRDIPKRCGWACLSLCQLWCQPGGAAICLLHLRSPFSFVPSSSQLLSDIQVALYSSCLFKR